MSDIEDIGREPKVPAIPKTHIADPKLRGVVDAVRTLLQTRTEDGVDRWLTWRDLVQNGIVTYQVGNRTFKGDSNVFFPVGGDGSDFSIPPTPKNVTATGGLGVIFIEWEGNDYSNHAYTEVWRSATNDLGTAVLLGTSQASLYVDYVGNNLTYYYWVRFVSKNDVKGAYQGTNGVAGSTSMDPAYVLELLAGEITESQLYSSLAARINLIDAASSVAGSVNARVQSEASDRAAAILAEASTRASADSALQTQINTLSAASSGDFQELIAALQEEQTARISADSAEVTARETLASQIRGTYSGNDLSLVTTGLLFQERTARTSADTALTSSITALSSTVTNNFNTLNSAITTEQTTRASADSALSASITSLTANKNRSYRQPAAPSGTSHAVGDIWFASDDSNKPYRWDGFSWVATEDLRISVNAAAITSEQSARISADNALTTSITNLTSTVNSNLSTVNAAISAEATTRANADTALTSQINTLSSTVTSNNTTLTAAIQTEATTRASVDNGLLAQYTVKVDVNGRVAGFGLASTSNGGTPTSSFVVIADKFAVVSPSNTGETPKVPFVIGTVDGQTVVAISNAMIQDAAISNAKIGTAAITTAKIADLSVSSAKIADAAITTAKIANAAIGTAQIAFAAIDTANINNGAITNAKLQDASITTAKIADASITNAKIANLSVDAAKIAEGTITNAKIANATITGAKIADLQVGTATFSVASAVSGARLEINNQVIRVYDSNGVLRVKIGNLAA